MIFDLLWLLVSLALVVKGGDLFVTSSVRIAEILRMPRLVIGSTLMSLATTTPEMTVSIIAGLRAEPGLAVGNAVGSCICNLSLILGTMAVVERVVVHPSAVRSPYLVMLGLGMLVLLLTWSLRLAQWQGLGLVVLGVAYFMYDFRRHWPRGEARGDGRNGAPRSAAGIPAGASGWVRAGQFALGAILVVGGSRLLVDAAVHIATGLGVPTIVIGLSVVAIGTSLPELVTAVTSARKDVSDLALGNLLGANIANLSLIVGSAASLHELTLTRFTQVLNFPAMLILMLLVANFGLSDRLVSRREGSLLLAYYATYLVLLVGLTLAGGR